MIKTFKRMFRNAEEMSVKGIEVWAVRWTSITGPYSSDKQSVAEFFTSEDDAKAFKSALEDAFKLTRNCHNKVTLKKESG